MPNFVNEGAEVLRNPKEPGDDGPAVVNSALIVPPKDGEYINDGPVNDTTKEFVIQEDER